jgi:hypothetical protein
MPWQEAGPMQERLGFVMDVLEGRYDVAEACERRGISRKTGYEHDRGRGKNQRTRTSTTTTTSTITGSSQAGLPNCVR